MSERRDEFQQWLTASMADAAAKLKPILPDGVTAEYNTAPIDVTKLSAYVPVSDELVHPEAYPPVHISRHTRLRWWCRGWRERVGRKVGSWIAGVDLSERDDDG